MYMLLLQNIHIILEEIRKKRKAPSKRKEKNRRDGEHLTSGPCWWVVLWVDCWILWW